MYVFLHLISPALTSSRGPGGEGCAQHDDGGFSLRLHSTFGSDLHVHTCRSLHRLKCGLSHGCCTAAALLVDPQEELIVRSRSTGAGEKPGVGKSVMGSM